MAFAEDEESRTEPRHSQDMERSSNEPEQEQALLERWKEGGSDAEAGPTSRKPRRQVEVPVGPALWAVGTSVALVAIAIMVAILTGVWRAQLGDSVQTNEYILRNDWEFDAAPQRREFHWTIEDKEHNPDGIYRPMILINNQFPGPLIEVNEGDTIVVYVSNRAQNATSIHWHGIYQNGTAHMDGTAGISQCPIPPGGKFTYEFTVNGQSGSYWYHSHVGPQAADGVLGPLVIHAKNEKAMEQIEYATDRVLLLQDHYHDLSGALLWQYLKPDMENAEPVPNGALINGRSIRNCDDFPDRKCDNTTATVGLPILDLAPNQNHRLRIINVGAFAEFQVQIDEHQIAVTEVDGTNVVPVSYHRLNINPAQRYSIVVNTTVSTAESFWLRAKMITTCFTDPPKTVDPEVRAIIRYAEASNRKAELPRSIDWDDAPWLECRDMNTTELVPMGKIAAPETADAFFYLRSNFEIGAHRLSRGMWNSSSFRPNLRSPTLLRAVDGLSKNDVSFTPLENQKSFVNDQAFDITRELVIQTTGIQTIDILISNFDDGNHPVHIHGYKYFVLASGGGYPPRTSLAAPMDRASLAPLYDSLDLSNPLRRDTASVEGFGWLLIRLVADNPGAWPLHCHVTWHSEAGLLMQLLTRSDEVSRMQIPQTNRDLCAADGIENGSGPSDEYYAAMDGAS